MFICDECEYVFPEEECEYTVNSKGALPKCPHCKSNNVSLAIQCVFCKKYHSVDEMGYVSGMCESCARNDFDITKFKDYCEQWHLSDLEDFFVEYLYDVELRITSNSRKLVDTLKDKFFMDYVNGNEHEREDLEQTAWQWIEENALPNYCEWRLEYEN